MVTQVIIFRGDTSSTAYTHRYNTMTSSNWNIFRVTGPLCGEFTGPGELPTQRPVTRSFDVFFHLRLNKRLSKQSRGWRFGTPSWSLWRQCNEYSAIYLFTLPCITHAEACCQPANGRLNSWWRHQMEPFTALLRVIQQSTLNSPHKGQWRGAFMFYLICAWINRWVNNREAGDLRRHRPHYDVTLMLRLHFECVSLLAEPLFGTAALIISCIHYNDVMMGAIASQITSLTIVYSIVYSDTDQRKHQSSASQPLCGEFTGDRWIPRTKGQLRGNVSIWWRHYVANCDDGRQRKHGSDISEYLI